MGRKPNPFVARYFDRGHKLGDSSNRYQHTCKACGVFFPKGRVEVLISHLLKKCPSLPAAEKQSLVLQAHGLPDVIDTQGARDAGTRQQNSNPSKPTSFANPRDNFNGLNVLAEASRRVGSNDSPEVRGYTLAEPGANHALALDPSLDVESFASSFLNIADDNMGSKLNTGFETTGPPTFSPMFSSDGQASRQPELPSSQRTHGPDLESIAASVNDMMPGGSDLDLSHGTIADELLLDKVDSTTSKSHPKGVQLERPFSPPCGPPGLSGASGSLRRLAMHPSPNSAHFITESGTSARSTKPKVRGKFSPDRRKEVQSVRKKGACLRCRILKKTCSGDDPCSACVAIENPRVWKSGCVRTKLVNEFKAFFAGLPSTLSYREISNVKKTTVCEPFDGYVEAFHFEDTPCVIVFKASQFKADSQNMTIGSNLSVSQSPIENECGPLMIDTSNDEFGLALKIERYMHETHPALITAESSPVLKSILEVAHRLLADQSDPILEHTVELCTTILVLVDPRFDFKLVAYPGPLPESSMPARGPLNQGLPLTPTEWPQSFRLLNSQLRAAVDKRAASMAKAIMMDLERRLLQKAHENRFHTFIASVLLLNCVERMCWEYGKWQFETGVTWPLDKSPESYADEGDTFADILQSLLNMRTLPPNLTVMPDTKLIVPEGEVEKVVQEFFEEIAVTPEFLKTATEHPFVSSDCRCLDAKLFSRLLRPFRGSKEKKDS